MHSPSPSSSSPPSKLSLSSLAQYTVFALVLYVLAGAPLSNVITNVNSAGGKSRTSWEKTSSTMGPEKMSSLVFPERNLTCEPHAFKGVYVLSREPLVVYIEGFLGEAETDEVIGLSTPLFTPSTIWHANRETLDLSIRHSEKAPLPRSTTVKCIEERARTFQGWRPFTFVEKLWTQRYGTGGHYTYHYDWSTATSTSGRVSSFMVYLQAECTGGGTHFPRLKKPAGKEWCRFIECPDDQTEKNEMKAEKQNEKDAKQDEILSQGVIFKPIKGNAVFWENMRSDGSGYAESWHAGLPVKSGVKIGLNIWSWWQEGYAPVEQEDESGEQVARGGEL